MAQVNNIVMPKLGLTMEEGVLVEWQVAPGDRVNSGQVIFVVETDKLATEIEATGEGEILALVAQQGETVPVGAVVAKWTGASSPETAEVETGSAGPAIEPAVPGGVKTVLPAKPTKGFGARGRVIATPLARRRAMQNGIDLGALSGSGPRGRIKLADVEAAQSRNADPAPAAQPQPNTAFGGVMATPHQLTVARRLSESKREIPHFYLAAEADMTALTALRSQLNSGGAYAKLSINHFILAAVARVWRDRPEANRVWQDGFLAEFAAVDVGFAVDTVRGLYAPVIANAGALDLDRLAANADAIAARARAGKLSAAEMSGGAVSVSNVGMHAVTYLTPIINPGQSAIVGVGTLRPVFRPDADGKPVLRQELGLVLACDHRVFNGVLAAQLLTDIVAYLEAPLRMLRTPMREGHLS